jgi:hypothetical protein
MHFSKIREYLKSERIGIQKRDDRTTVRSGAETPQDNSQALGPEVTVFFGAEKKIVINSRKSNKNHDLAQLIWVSVYHYI